MCTSAFAREPFAQSQFDGDFWIPRTQDGKMLYVVGFVDGRNHGINDAAEALGTKIDDPRISKLASKVTVGQIFDGKMLYVVGFVDGRNHGINDAAEALGTKIDDPRISKLASKVTVGQIFDG